MDNYLMQNLSIFAQDGKLIWNL